MDSLVLIPMPPLAGLLPLALLVAAAFAVLLLDAFVPRSRRHLPLFAGLVLAAAVGIACRSLGAPPEAPFPGHYLADDFAHFFDVLVGLAALGALGISARRAELGRGEYPALLLLASAGMGVLAHAASLVVVFLGLEVLSIALYALTAFLPGRQASVEAGLKYFFLGAFASAFLVYGMALVYGMTGTFEIERMGAVLAARAATGQPLPLLVPVGAALLLVGFGFKISSVPFHAWTPDVYHGAPTAVAAFMSVGTKAAAFAALLRVFTGGLAAAAPDWRWPVAAVAVLTMMAGNLTALTQSNLKRMLAWSSVAHAGYILIGLVAYETAGRQAILFYLLGYAFMNLGAFAVVAALERDGGDVWVQDVAGLARRRPWLAAAFALFLLSLAGVPPTAGFAGKLGLFLAVLDAGWVGLAVLAVLYSAVAAYFYLRVIVYMYLHPAPGTDALAPAPAGAGSTVVLAAAAAGVGLVGLVPGPVLLLLDHIVAGL